MDLPQGPEFGALTNDPQIAPDKRDKFRHQKMYISPNYTK